MRADAGLVGLALAGVRRHAALHAGILAAAGLAVALVAGGLAVGDGLRTALSDRVSRRVGPVTAVVEASGGGATTALADRLVAAGLGRVAPVLRRDAVASHDGVALPVVMWAADARLDALSDLPVVPAPGTARAPASWMARAGVAEGDRIVLRFARPSHLSVESALGRAEAAITPLSVVLGPALPDAWPRDLELRATPGRPDVVLVHHEDVAAAWGGAPRASHVLVADDSPEAVAGALDTAWRLEDAGLGWSSSSHGLTLGAEAVLLPREVVQAGVDTGGRPALVWLVDRLRAGADGDVSYAFVAGAEGVAGVDPGDGVVLTDWLADGLDVGEGADVVLRSPRLGARRGLVYEEVSLRVTGVVGVDGERADPTWMPPIEGVADADSCRAWDPGLPIELSRITDRDEAWWSEHRGAPKAWVSLDTARRLWAGPDGDTTALRWPAGSDPQVVEAALRARLQPGSVGLRVTDPRGHLQAAAAPANDFGALFAGFQTVLLAAVLALAALQAGFGIDTRRRELGVLRSVGWSRGRVARLLLMELGLVGGVGALLGLPLAVGVAALLHLGLSGVWSSAAPGMAVPLTLRVGTLAAGAVGAWLTVWLATAVAVWREVRRPPRDLLAGSAPPTVRGRRARAWLATGVGLAVAVGILATTPPSRTPATALAFFGAGGGVWIAGLGLVALWLGRAGGGVGLAAMIVAGVRRRPGRSLAVVGLLSTGVFLVVGVGLGAGRAPPEASARHGGAGGFDLWVETAVPLAVDPRTREGRDALVLRADTFEGVELLPVRRVAGDDASCLQLGAAQTPTLLGLDAARLATLDAFDFVDAPADEPEPWRLLHADLGPGRIPAVGDVPTVTWGLHRGRGDGLRFGLPDGTSVEVVIVGIVDASILQGALVVDEAVLAKAFGEAAPTRGLLVDAPPDRIDAVRAELSRALVDVGASLEPTADRLHRFTEVEDAYVAIFRALGGLGLVLGAAGVGLVLARAAVERRGELALLRAVGFPVARVRRLLVLEHGLLVLAGLGVGVASAAMASLPILLARDGALPWPPLALSLGGMVVVAWAALRVAAGRLLSGAPLRELSRDRT